VRLFCDWLKLWLNAMAGRVARLSSFDGLEGEVKRFIMARMCFWAELMPSCALMIFPSELCRDRTGLRRWCELPGLARALLILRNSTDAAEGV
jgi:hypothetical protein